MIFILTVDSHLLLFIFLTYFYTMLPMYKLLYAIPLHREKRLSQFDSPFESSAHPTINAPLLVNLN